MSNRLDGFLFSQTSLQDWLQCKRRFRYLYLDNLAYPAPETADQIEFERHMEQGDQFHRLVHQHLVGIPAEVIRKRIEDAQVRAWWQNYLAGGLNGLPDKRFAEVTLTAPVGDYRLIAKYDLVAVAPGERVVIVDWKTAVNRPRAATLEQRIQTVVYRYLMVEAGAYYNGGIPLQPEQVEMVYWFTNFPAEPERLPYTTAQYQLDKALLGNLVREVATEQTFPKVDEIERERVCRFCNYRSLCWDDVNAGAFADMLMLDEDEADSSFDIDLDQIAEIEF